MASWGSCDYAQLLEFQKKLEALAKGQEKEQFLESCAKELAARLLAKAILRTPVGQYSVQSGKRGGTLRRGWTGGTDTSAANYAKSISITKAGDYYRIIITNPVEYAQYVEFGHRTIKKDGCGWCEGKHMLQISEQELNSIAPQVLDAKLTKFLKKEFG